MKNLEKLKNLINIKSYSLYENKEIIDYLCNEFKAYTNEIVRIKNKNNDKENLLIGLNCPLKNISDTIILSGHIDTVTANEKEYKTPPCLATEIDDKIFGLGSIDMKSFFATILNLCDKLKKLTNPIVIAITSDEETHLNGINNLVDYLKNNNIVPKLSIIGEPTNLYICAESNSCFEYEINITGKSCHSSNPKNGTNANYIAAKIISFIERLCYKYKKQL